MTQFDPVTLGPAETIFWQGETDIAGAFRVAVIMQVDGFIEEDYLIAALRMVQHRHPKLRAKVVLNDDRTFYYEAVLDSRQIPCVIKDYGDLELPWREEVRTLLETKFPIEGPLAAMSVLRSRSRANSTLLLSVHHSIADGMSALALLQELLEVYALAETGAELKIEQFAVLPVITALHAKGSRSWRQRLWLARRFKRLQNIERQSLQTSLPESDQIVPYSQWQHWIFSSEETVRLVKRCRKEQTSLDGVLIAASFCALMDSLPISNAMFKCQLPMNIRNYAESQSFPITDQDLGCFVSVINEFFEVAQRPVFWNLARTVHQRIGMFTAQGGPSFYYNLLASGLKIAQRFPRLVQKTVPAYNRRVNVFATSYGVLDFRDSYGRLRPSGCTLVFRNTQIGPSIIMEGLILGKQLNVGFVGECLEPLFWSALQANVRNYLNVAVGAI